MLEKGWPWDSTEGDTREYGAQEIADAFTSFIKNGVLDAEGDFLLTPQSGNTLRISSGTAWINGRMLKLDGFEDIAIPYVSASETPRYGVLGLLLRPDVDHRDFTFFYMPPDGNELPALGENEIAIAKIRYDRGTPAISAEHIIRDVERAYTTNPYYDKKGFTLEFLNEVVSSYMEFTPEGIAIYDGPASDTGRKMVFGYDVVEKALRIVGEFTSTPRDINGFILETKVGEVSFVENDESIKKVSGIGVQDVSGNVRAIIGASKPIDTALSDAISAYMCADGQITIESSPKVNRINASVGFATTAPSGKRATFDLISSNSKAMVSAEADYFTFNGNGIWHEGNTGVQRVQLKPSISHGANQSFYIKDPVTNIVHVNIAASGMPITSEKVIATLPAGFRPGQLVYCGITSGGDAAVYGYVSENGEIKAKNMILSTKPEAWTFLQFTFVAEN